MFCKHKYGEVKDSYQYCEKCGSAKAAPEVDCSHQWVQLDRFEVSNIINKNITGHIYVLNCTKCGDIKEHRT